MSDPSDSDEASKSRSDAKRHRSALPPLSTSARVLLLILGWLLIFLGLAGLVLPGLQGIITLVFGGAVLSLVSPTIHGLLRRVFMPWPRAWRRLLRLRRRVHSWFVK